MRVAVVLNPEAHAGRAGQAQATLEAALPSRGVDAAVRRTEGAGHAAAIVQSLPDDFDAVVSAGGDGTLFEVVNGLMARPAERRPPLAILPMGTGNAFARDLGLEPGAVDAALDALVAGHTRLVDVAEVRHPGGGFHYLNILGVGFVTRAARAATALKGLGRGAYTLGALAALLRIPSLPLELELDGARLPVQESFFVEVANSRYTGTRFLMAPDARIDDGLLDVVLVGRLPRRRALRLFPAIYDGRHVAAREVSVFQARTVRLCAPVGLECLVDGEFRGRTPLEITCRPGQLRMFAVR